jgi:hypothetical protein
MNKSISIFVQLPNKFCGCQEIFNFIIAYVAFLKNIPYTKLFLCCASCCVSDIKVLYTVTQQRGFDNCIIKRLKSRENNKSISHTTRFRQFDHRHIVCMNKNIQNAYTRLFSQNNIVAIEYFSFNTLKLVI